ncbi:MAG: tripartite tricarboxylate transporter permease [archaeon]
MFTEILLFTLAGCGLGIITGLVPGIHINMVSALVLAGLPFFAGFETLSVAAMIMAMAVTHTFLDFIPSILLGAPDGETALAVLPGHTMLLEGRAIEAIKLTGLGSLMALLIAAGLFLVMVKWVGPVYEFIKPNLHFVLLFMILLGFAAEKNTWRAVFVFLAAGFFGFFVLGSAFPEGMIFPALSGMFGVSTMLLSLREKVRIPIQARANINLKLGEIVRGSVVGSVAGMLVGMLPGIGAAQATFVAQQVTRKSSVQEFLVAVSGVNTANMIFTMVVLYSLGKMRSGIMVVIDDMLGEMIFGQLLLFLGVILLAGGVALFLHIKLGMFFALKLSGGGSNYGKINVCIILVITASVFALTGGIGLVVLLVGTALGLLPPLLSVRRAECMGFLLFPVVLFYTGLYAIFAVFLGIV